MMRKQIMENRNKEMKGRLNPIWAKIAKNMVTPKIIRRSKLADT